MKKSESDIKKKSERNSGIDLLRIVAMFYIGILHIIGYGGISDAVTNKGTVMMVWFIVIFARCAVNCFALTSGYVGYKEQQGEYKYSKYISLWLQAVFYGILGALIFLILKKDLLYFKHFILGFVPITSNQWWYFTAYTGLFFLIPWLNEFIRMVSKKNLTKIVFCFAIVFSVFPTIAALFKEPFNLNEGFSMLWLIILYVIGAWMKKCDVVERIDLKRTMLLGVISLLLTWLNKILSIFSGRDNMDVFYSYISPTIVCIAIVHLVFFARLKIGVKLKRVIAYFSPAAFGVYLFHMQWDILDNAITSRFRFVAELPTWKIPIHIVVYAGIILIVGLVIDKMRNYLFQILRIDKMATYIEKKIKKNVQCVLERFNKNLF